MICFSRLRCAVRCVPRGSLISMLVFVTCLCSCSRKARTSCERNDPDPRRNAFAPTRIEYVPISEAVLRDKISGAWLGQMIGVTWGFPTEFYARYIWRLFPEIHQVEGRPQNIYAGFEGGPIPLDLLPAWKPDMINGAYTQDDLYVEVPFMIALREHGVNTGWTALGAAFAESEFPLWHANAAARKNLRAGITPPMSGHYSNGGESDDLDWQIESDFVGLINPGQLHSAADMSFRVGHIMNYGDGVYGGVFVATMISSAFTAENVREVVEAGRNAVPHGSKYRMILDEVFASHDRGDSFDANLAAINARWGNQDRCVEWGGDKDPLNIDAKINGAYILLGLLYGHGDLADSMRLAMACGQDSDCNPSNVGSILGAFRGRDAILADEADWLSALDTELVFETTAYKLDDLVNISLELAREIVELKGGAAPPGGVWQLPVVKADVPLILEQWPETENAAPVLDISVEKVDGLTIRLRAQATDTDGIETYQWFLGDLTYASGRTICHTYRTPGSYEVIAYTADSTGNTSCKTVKVTVP